RARIRSLILVSPIRSSDFSLGWNLHLHYCSFKFCESPIEIVCDTRCFEIEPNQERLINLVKNNIFDDSSNDSLLEEVDLFLSDNSIPSGIENVADDPEGDIRFLKELLIDDSILSHEPSDFIFEENLSIPRPPPEPPDVETDAGEDIPVMMNDKYEDVDYSYSMFVIFDKMFSLLFAESEDTIFDHGIFD
nr:hypothetical protein [Tanacetum cinerariifolium]